MIGATNITTEALEGYEDMMTEAYLTIRKPSPLAIAIWSEVLRELDLRGRVRLINGSYEDIGNSLIQRLRD